MNHEIEMKTFIKRCSERGALEQRCTEMFTVFLE